MCSLSPSYSSMIWASSEVPSVAVTRACVSPRVKSAEPWVRGRMPTSQVIGRIWANSRPSRRLPAEDRLARQDLDEVVGGLGDLLARSGSVSGTSEAAAFLTALISA